MLTVSKKQAIFDLANEQNFLCGILASAKSCKNMSFAVTKFGIGQIGVGHSSFIAGFLWNSDIISISWQKTFSI